MSIKFTPESSFQQIFFLAFLASVGPSSVLLGAIILLSPTPNSRLVCGRVRVGTLCTRCWGSRNAVYYLTRRYRITGFVFARAAGDLFEFEYSSGCPFKQHLIYYELWYTYMYVYVSLYPSLFFHLSCLFFLSFFHILGVYKHWSGFSSKKIKQV